MLSLCHPIACQLYRPVLTFVIACCIAVSLWAYNAPQVVFGFVDAGCKAAPAHATHRAAGFHVETNS